MSGRSEFLSVAERLLELTGQAMSPQELVDMALEKDLFTRNIAGRTPAQTMKSKLSVDIRRRGAQSPFVRTMPGKFYLRRLVADSAELYTSPPLVPPAPNEHVLVIPAAWMDAYGRFQGVRRAWQPFARALFRSGRCVYMDRREAELTTEYKQLLTYVMVTRGRRVLTFKRGNYTRADQFLRGSHCLGFGGHVTAVDRDLFSLADFGVRSCAAREIREELELPPPDRHRLASPEALRIVGVLNDDSSDNGQRHAAFLLQYEVSQDPYWDRPKRNEKSITQLRWLDPAVSPQSMWSFEYWSQLCLLTYYQNAAITRPTFVLPRRALARLRPPAVLVVVGPLGSGKSEATQVLRRQYGYAEVNSGKLLAELLGRPVVSEETREAFQEAAWEFIERPDGVGLLADAIWRAVMVADSDRVLVDGIRQQATLERLMGLARPRRLGVVYVHTPAHLAFSFYRRRSGESVDMLRFYRRRTAAVEGETERFLRSADAVLYNWQGLAAYQEIIRHMMSALAVPERDR